MTIIVVIMNNCNIICEKGLKAISPKPWATSRQRPHVIRYCEEVPIWSLGVPYYNYSIMGPETLF